MNLDKMDPHGHGLGEPYSEKSEVAYRIEQAFLRGFSHGLSGLRQFWDRKPPKSLSVALREIGECEEWARSQRYAHQRNEKRRPYMMDAMTDRLRILRERK